MSLVNDALKKARMEAARSETADRNLHYPLLGRRERETSAAWIFGLGALVLLAGIGGVFLFRSGKQSALKEQVATVTNADRSSVPGAETATALETPAASDSGAIAVAEPDQDRRLEPETALPQQNPPQAATAVDGSAPATSNPRAVRGEERRPLPQAQPSPVPIMGEQASTATPTAPAPQPAAPPTVQQAVRASAPPAATDAGDTGGAANVEPGSQSGTEERVPAVEPAEDQNLTAEPASEEFLQRADIPGIGPVELGGIAWSGDRPFALVNGRVVRPGDSVSGLIVDDIQPNTVRLRGDNGTLIFRLK